jgi:hypothetical protein
MHFPLRSHCLTCHQGKTYSEPVLSVLILASVCSNCGWSDCVGWEGEGICVICAREIAQEIERRYGGKGQIPS